MLVRRIPLTGDRKTSRPRRRRPRRGRLIAGLVCGLLSLGSTKLWAQGAELPHAGLPLGDPVVAADVELQAQRTSVWREGKAHYLLLDRDVSITIGTYGFRADQAVVQIVEEEVAGRRIRHTWLMLDKARALRGKGPTTVEAPELLVTASTTGLVDLKTDLLSEQTPTADQPLLTVARQRFSDYLATISQPTRGLPPADEAVKQADIQALALRDTRRREIAAAVPTAEGAKATLPMHVTPLTPGSAPAPGTAPGAAPGTAPGTAEVAATPATPAAPATPPPAPTIVPASPAVAKATVRPATDKEVAATTQPAARPADAAAPRADQGQILPPSGTVSVSYDRMVIQPGGDEPVAMLFGKVGVMFVSDDGTTTMSLTADRAVIFLDRASVPREPFAKVNSDAVVGVYLEDDVLATDGQYFVRAPRVYYDRKLNKAMILDAVMYTWDPRKEIPFYLRAKKIMQHSSTVWQASEATLTTSEFAKPHFAVAARKVTVTQVKDRQGLPRYAYVAEDAAVRWADLPLMPSWPKLSGYAEDLPLRSLDVGYSENNGMRLRTRWDLFSLSGQPKPEGVNLFGRFDMHGQHGIGTGYDLDYDQDQQFGNHKAYILPYDQGEDHLGDGRKVDFDGDVRGYLHGQHRQYLEQNWELSLEYAYVSDPTFLEAFFPGEAGAAPQYDTSLYLKKQQDDWALTFETSYDLNDFVTQYTTLQSPGYNVDKLPELGLYKIGTSLWDNRLTWYSENQLSRMRIRPGDDSPSDRGFNNAQSLLLFGVPAATRFHDALETAGVPLGYVSRLDSRQELQAPLKLGTIDVVPYVTGRVTFYDDDFAEFAGESDATRLWGESGVRLHTQFHKTISNADNRLFDIHQLRHIIEPSAQVSLAGSSLESEDLPVFDPDVESLSEGATFKAGLRNTLQTQRGGPGRWYSVDWITLDTDLIHKSDDARDNNLAIPRHFDYRPEYDLGGDQFHTRLAWMITDALAAAGEWTHDLDDDRTAQWRLGMTMRHTPQLTSYLDYSELHELDSRLLSYGFTYDLTVKYSLAFRHTIDIGGAAARDIEVTLVRKLPSWRLIVVYEYDELDDDHTYGVVLVPVGIGGSRYSRPLFMRELE
ncbi:MAG: LPS assembly protein LptD [Phycisphaeraceae bacterium]|nr:LPS assembly protein LptD [Phycisphaeraceae bacterium]